MKAILYAPASDKIGFAGLAAAVLGGLYSMVFRREHRSDERSLEGKPLVELDPSFAP